jgi:hypothetical protein
MAYTGLLVLRGLVRSLYPHLYADAVLVHRVSPLHCYSSVAIRISRQSVFTNINSHTFSTLDLSMQSTSLLLVLLFGVSLLMPALILMNRWTEMNSFLVLIYTVFFTVLEVVVYYQGVYSGLIVLFTSAAGTYVTIKYVVYNNYFFFLEFSRSILYLRLASIF